MSNNIEIIKDGERFEDLPKSIQENDLFKVVAYFYNMCKRVDKGFTHPTKIDWNYWETICKKEIDKAISKATQQPIVEQDKDIDYQTFAKKYKNPYTELESKERIRALEERLFSNEWALVEVRATRDILIKLNDVANTVNKELAINFAKFLIKKYSIVGYFNKEEAKRGWADNHPDGNIIYTEEQLFEKFINQ